jgi:hypothetical protein
MRFVIGRQNKKPSNEAINLCRGWSYEYTIRLMRLTSERRRDILYLKTNHIKMANDERLPAKRYLLSDGSLMTRYEPQPEGVGE